jgi:hypothetical protein
VTWTTSNIINFKIANCCGFEGLEVKPYLLGDASYANQYYLSHNLKPIDGNLLEITFNQQMNVGRVGI